MGIAINGGNLVKSDGSVLGKVVHEKCGRDNGENVQLGRFWPAMCNLC